MLGCHLSLHHDVFIFCRASSFFLPSITTDKPCRFVYESLLGHTLVQRNKHHSSTSIAFVSVCRRRPSARRADPSDGESLNTHNNQKTGTQCGAYGWLQRCNQHQQAAGRLPNGRLQSRMKIILSLQKNSSGCMTLPGRPTGRPYNVLYHHKCYNNRQCSSVLHHHRCTDEEALGSSAQLTLGDVG